MNRKKKIDERRRQFTSSHQLYNNDNIHHRYKKRDDGNAEETSKINDKWDKKDFYLNFNGSYKRNHQHQNVSYSRTPNPPQKDAIKQYQSFIQRNQPSPLYDVDLHSQKGLIEKKRNQQTGSTARHRRAASYFKSGQIKKQISCRQKGKQKWINLLQELKKRSGQQTSIKTSEGSTNTNMKINIETDKWMNVGVTREEMGCQQKGKVGERGRGEVGEQMQVEMLVRQMHMQELHYSMVMVQQQVKNKQKAIELARRVYH